MISKNDNHDSTQTSSSSPTLKHIATTKPIYDSDNKYLLLYRKSLGIKNLTVEPRLKK
jgi:hypothetical protein